MNHTKRFKLFNLSLKGKKGMKYKKKEQNKKEERKEETKRDSRLEMRQLGRLGVCLHLIHVGGRDLLFFLLLFLSFFDAGKNSLDEGGVLFGEGFSILRVSFVENSGKEEVDVLLSSTDFSQIQEVLQDLCVSDEARSNHWWMALQRQVALLVHLVANVLVDEFWMLDEMSFAVFEALALDVIHHHAFINFRLVFGANAFRFVLRPVVSLALLAAVKGFFTTSTFREASSRLSTFRTRSFHWLLFNSVFSSFLLGSGELI